jgi:hypothetical protein
MKQFTLLQLFSIVDGRLSTDIGDVYEMLNAYTGDSLMTHHIPVAMDFLKSKSPSWFVEAESYLNEIKSLAGNDFNALMTEIKAHHHGVSFIIEQMPESDREHFECYMINNSLLLKKLNS